MTFSLSKWSAFALLPCLVAACVDDSPDLREELELRALSLASLVGSDFEIDVDANLMPEGVGMMDWASPEVVETRKADAPSGTSDDSYKGGAKEDDPCPPVGSGGIPNNKSDLKHLGVYAEKNMLHVYWSRVQDPSGTTLMDFEFNQSDTVCANGVNKVRTKNDLLLEYKVSGGGSAAAIVARLWNGSKWGPAVTLTNLDPPAATGTINTSTILAKDSDGLGEHSPRTFGEASIDLDAIFGAGKCVSFGSALLKSRSSDSFTSALKDFIVAEEISITNCGGVIIRKETEPAGLKGFEFTTNLLTESGEVKSFKLDGGGEARYSNVLFGSYHVTEAELGPGMKLDDIDCKASSDDVDYSIDLAARTVKFTIDEETDVLDCTFSNRRSLTDLTVTVESQVYGGTSSTIDCESNELLAPKQVVTDDSGFGNLSIEDLPPGTYVCTVVITDK